MRNISDQASARAQREDREWKYQRKSVAGGLICKLSRVQDIVNQYLEFGFCYELFGLASFLVSWFALY